MNCTSKPCSFRLESSLADNFKESCEIQGKKPNEVIAELMNGYIEGNLPEIEKVTTQQSACSIVDLKLLLCVATNSKFTDILSPKKTPSIDHLYVEPKVEVNVEYPKGFKEGFVSDFTGSALICETDEAKRYAIMVDNIFTGERMAALEHEAMRNLQQAALLAKECEKKDEEIASLIDFISSLASTPVTIADLKAFISARTSTTATPTNAPLTPTAATPASAPINEQLVKELGEKLLNISKSNYEQAVEIFKQQDSQIETLKNELAAKDADIAKLTATNASLTAQVEKLEYNFVTYIEEAEDSERNLGNQIFELKKANASRIAELEKAFNLEVKEPETLIDTAAATLIDTAAASVPFDTAAATLINTAAASVPFDIEALTAKITASVEAAMDNNYVRKGEVLKELANEANSAQSTVVEPTYYPLEAIPEVSCAEYVAEFAAAVTLEPVTCGTATAVAEYDTMEGKQTPVETAAQPVVLAAKPSAPAIEDVVESPHQEPDSTTTPDKGASQSELDEGCAAATAYLREIVQVYAECTDEAAAPPQPKKARRADEMLEKIFNYLESTWIPAGNVKAPSLDRLVKEVGGSKTTHQKLRKEWDEKFKELVAQA